MAIDQNKIKKAAQKAVDRGQYDKAIHLLQKLIGRNTRDTRTLLKIGDLQRRKGDDRDAAKTLREVGEIYTEQGFFLKAVAVYKQVLKLTPNDIDVKLRLAEMYERLELVTEALATYEETVTLYARDGNVVKVLETLERMVKLDPDNVVVRIKYAEALSRDGRSSAAATQFEKSGELLQAQGRHEDFMKVGERLLYHRPDDIVLARKLATMYLERSDPKRALAKLQTCFRANASDVETLALLADAFEQLHQVPKAISVYREIARIQGERGEEIDRDRALRRIMSLAPTDALARETLAEIEARAAARTSDHLTIPAPGVYEPPDEASEPVIEVRAAAVSDLPPEPEEVLSDPAAAAWTRAPAALSDYADYDGGDLAIDSAGAEDFVKLPAGSLILYPATSLHRVTKVTRGARIACVGWIKSRVRSAEQRALLFDLDRIGADLAAVGPASSAMGDIRDRLANVRNNLLRRWGE